MMKSLLRAALACAALSGALVPTAHATDVVPEAHPRAQERLFLRGALTQPVQFHGALSLDKAGGGAGVMMYPAFGLVGFVAAVATHAAISNGMRDSEKAKLREEADKVLEPYRHALSGFTQAELVQRAGLGFRPEAETRVGPLDAPASGGETLVDGAPVFLLTQDQRAIVLDNAVRVTRGNTKPYEKIIRVVAPAQAAPATPAVWLDNDAAMLKAQSIRLYAMSLDIAMRDEQKGFDDKAPFKTVRYPEGGAEKMERAQIVSEQCDHLVLRTLRGHLMAVPRNGGPTDCAAIPANL